MAFLSIVGKFAFVRASIVPPENSLSMHFVAKPFTLIISAIGPGVLSIALDIIVAELANVASPIMPVELAATVLGAVDVGTLVTGLIWPSFYAMAVLLVVLPAALVHCSIIMHVLALAVCLIV